ncbi:MAG: hypothetical protein KBF47_13945 [Gemmatimonadales bacterium]|nr:hypothetical protein [Gemmatimonadales bacterium]
MNPDVWFLIVGAVAISWLAGYGYGWRDGYCHFAGEEVAADDAADSAINSEGWMGEALEWRALIKAAAMRDMEIPADDPSIHEDKFA